MKLLPRKETSAVLPIVMSLAALGIVVVHLSIFGTAREPDEGTAAHLWQILMAGQAPIIGYFALKWLPRAPRLALPMLALQIVAALTACAPVWWFQL